VQGRRTVFLDRDGVINSRVSGYINRVQDFELMPGVIDAIGRLARNGWRTVVVTNQRGIFTGDTQPEELARIHDHLTELVRNNGADLEIYHCPHDRVGPCDCRKPKPGLLDQADRREPVDWSQSWLVGDSDSDIEAARQRKLNTIKIGEPGHPRADYHAADLAGAVERILSDPPRC